MWKSTQKIAIASFALVFLPSCTMMGTMGAGEDGTAFMGGSPKAIAELSNLLAAQAQIAKDSPDLKGASWQLREAQETTRQLRIQFKKQEGQ